MFPSEIFFLIFSYCDEITLRNVSMTCKKFCNSKRLIEEIQTKVYATAIAAISRKNRKEYSITKEYDTVDILFKIGSAGLIKKVCQEILFKRDIFPYIFLRAVENEMIGLLDYLIELMRNVYNCYIDERSKSTATHNIKQKMEVRTKELKGVELLEGFKIHLIMTDEEFISFNEAFEYYLEDNCNYAFDRVAGEDFGALGYDKHEVVSRFVTKKILKEKSGHKILRYLIDQGFIIITQNVDLYDIALSKNKEIIAYIDENHRKYCIDYMMCSKLENRVIYDTFFKDVTYPAEILDATLKSMLTLKHYRKLHCIIKIKPEIIERNMEYLLTLSDSRGNRGNPSLILFLIEYIDEYEFIQKSAIRLAKLLAAHCTQWSI